ncbi:ATP-binding cassette sub-family A member 3-like isoform X2 [Actinia tenebrosa]|uniref:ATP-binding cassette sub-family A member 3-like isoform X2 n=1 Tax=Actinia tenebrosa TaxID=6105 RepID=A0A6P8HSG7_ACTTE|nr:ATP-binding cassette sub-family A member 3-like isoform X2 [Actinia tenebrosa]
MANRFRQFRLLLWKNFILQIRRPIGTVFEIILPILLVSILILPKTYIKPEEMCFSAPKPEFSSQNLKGSKDLRLAYYPLGDPVPLLMARISSMTGFTIVNSSIGGQPFSSLNQIVAEVAEHSDKYVGVVVFNLKEGQPLPKKVKYSIRLPTPSELNWRTERTYSSDGNTYYLSYVYAHKFVPLQYATDMTIIQAQSNTPRPIPITAQEFPIPGYLSDVFVSIMSVFAPLLVTLAFIYSAVSIIKEIVFEKQQRLKESMKMMGLENWVHWLAWYIKCLLFWSISVILATIVIKVFNIFEYSDGFVLFLFLLLYVASSISYCFFISVFFTNPTLSMLIGLVLWYVALLPYQIFAQSDSFGEQRKEKFDLLSKGAKSAMCLLPNSAFGIGITIFLRLESLRVGMSFKTLNVPTSPDDDLTLAWVMLMMTISIIIFTTLTWYIEGVYPGKYGIPKPFYFPLQKSYWCGYAHDIMKANAMDKERDPVENKDQDHHAVEDEPTDLQIGVGIKNLSKVFKSSAGNKVAVDGLSLNMYKGQITALLGHNGAGKTTTMSILTGLFPPTSGSAHIGNKSILTDIDGIRESLGLCPQHNVLFDRLTVKEHLEFFINLKGKYGQAAKDEVLAMITDMQLLDKMNEKSATLSGGMKRKLSCAIALVGGSETVILDEPTSGMDPYARRATWDLLLKYKPGKTIILTTHFMDEADFLGDRIAIMADGQLRCCGSSLFLKSRYGVGYHLTLVKDREFNENMTINAVKRFVPSAEILSNVGAELEMVLNKEAAKSFESLFLDLETKKQEYGIASFGVSVTTMEEVFMKVGEGAEKTVDDIISDHEHHRHTENIVNIPNDQAPEIGELQTGFAHKWQQYKAMLTKRFLNSKRDKKAVLTQLIFPCVLLVIGMLTVTNLDSSRGNDPPRLLKLSNLSVGGVNSKAFFGYFRDVNASAKASYLSIAQDYLSTVKVDTIDVTDNVNTIQSKNTLNGIQVKGKSYNYSSPVKGKLSPCCNYEFLILNAKCQKDFIEKSITAEECRSNEKFGYIKACGDCLSKNRDYSCTTKTIIETDLTRKRTFFIEYVLEKSNPNDFFRKHVAGFTIGPMTYIVNGPNVFVETKGSNTTTSNSSLTTTTTATPTTTPSWNPTTVWYSKEGLHTIAEAMNAMSNIFLKKLTSKEYEIETTNFPLPKVAKKESENSDGGTSVYLLVIFFAMGLACVAASFTTFIVQERVSKAKHLQFVSGVDSFCYWFGTYTWDYLNYLIPATLFLIIFAAFQVESFKDEMGSVFLLLLLFGIAVLPFVYIVSFVFTSSLIAYAVIAVLLSIIAMVLILARVSCTFPSSECYGARHVMHGFFMLVPTYTFAVSIFDMNENYQNKKICSNPGSRESYLWKADCTYTDHALSWDKPGVGQEALFMFLEGVVLLIITLLIQANFFISCKPKESPNSGHSQIQPSEDEDVYAERMRIAQLNKEQIDEEAVVLKDITKVYRGSNRTAVDHLNLGIPRGECFGLLGVNGAGKTSTFSMLTGDQSISDGTAFLDGYNIQTHLKQVQQRIGYCPQFDALIERMTGREMLVMYSQLRGVAPDKINDVVSSLIEHLNLGKWADKLCGNFSGGNKRKLSTAIALVGNPPIVFLDEPTSGMDPVARRFLWDSLTSVMKGGRSIVLTSHSMEECEALCTRLAIMVNGQFKCIGSPQHLKNRFSSGYSLMVKIKGQSNCQRTVETIAAEHEGVQQATATTFINPMAAGNLPDDEHGPSNAVTPFQPVVQGPDNGNLAEDIQRVKAFIDESFPGAVLTDSHAGMLTYQIINEDLTWSQIFGQLERNRESLNIIDYSVSQTTLEQVFINFAKNQYLDEKTKKKKCGCFPC